MKKIVIIFLMLGIGIYIDNLLIAAEHPGTGTGVEEPVKGSKEHPGESSGHHKAAISKDKIVKAIKDHIDEMTKASGGTFPLYDEKEGKSLKLKLVRVHEDRVSYITKEDAYFACTDFKTDDGKAAYDIDFWMKANEDGKLSVYMTKIHKKDGVERYTYKEDEIVPVEEKGSKGSDEHPGTVR